MDDSSSLLALFALWTANGLLTLAYAAISNTRPMQLKDQAEDGNLTAQRLLALLELEPRLSITYKLLNTVLHMSIVLLVIRLVFGVHFTNPAFIVPILLAVVVIGIITVILADMVPESIGSAYAVPMSHLLVPILQLVVFAFFPFVWAAQTLSYWISRLFGSSGQVNTVTEEEIMTLVSAGHTGGAIEEEEKEMIYSVLQLGETNARELMTPRLNVVALPADNSIAQALDKFIERGFSRVPVYEENIDNIVGLLYAKDLLPIWRDGQTTLEAPIRDLIRPAYFVPEEKRADELLSDLRARNIHMAVVVDEYGGTSGIVTIENLIEEIVGDIRDEYDQNEEAEYILEPAGTYIMDAAMDLDDFNDLLQTDIATDEADTVGGFIYLQLGRVPTLNEVVITDKLSLTVIEIDGPRIRKVRVAPQSPAKTDAPTDDTKAESATDDTKLEDNPLPSPKSESV